MDRSSVDAPSGAYVIAFDDSEITARSGSRIVRTSQVVIWEETGAFVGYAEEDGLTATELHLLEAECKKMNALYE